jgi:hypothetical protein
MRYISPDVAFYDDAVYAVIPKGSIKLSAEKYTELLAGIADGKSIQIVAGEPILVDWPLELLTRDQTEAFRLRSYADPLTGSDRYFAEAQRMKIMGEPGWEQINTAGISRFEEIQALYPWV